MNNSISIFLHYGEGPERQITVNEFDQVGTLQQYVPDTANDRIIIANNSVLMPAFSFKYHSIKDGDHMYVIRTRMHRKGAKAQERSKASHGYWKRRIQIMNKSDKTTEASRLVDLHLNRMEWYQSPIFAEAAIPEQLDRPTSTLLIPTDPSPTAPSCEALPFTFVAN